MKKMLLAAAFAAAFAGSALAQSGLVTFAFIGELSGAGAVSSAAAAIGPAGDDASPTAEKSMGWRRLENLIGGCSLPKRGRGEPKIRPPDRRPPAPLSGWPMAGADANDGVTFAPAEADCRNRREGPPRA